MAETAYQIQYRQEFIHGFEQTQSLLRAHVTTEAVVKGNQATFLVADSGGAEAKTRGVNGKIPSRGDNLSQPVATLTEQHDKVIKTNFNIFASQGDQRRVMQATSMAVLNRKEDSQIITSLDTATRYAGLTAVTADLALVMRAKAILGNSDVPWDGNICFLITPAMEAYLSQTREFASREYVSAPTMDSGNPAWRDKPLEFYWQGAYWVTHPNLPGHNTASETCYAFHRSGIGHARDTAGMQYETGYNAEDDYSFARATCYMGGVLLQNTGVVKIRHDGSAFASTA